MFTAVEFEQEFEHVLAVGGVEIAGGLVSHENRRARHEGSGEGDALLLAAGELDGVVIAAFGETHFVEQLAGARRAIASAAG